MARKNRKVKGKRYNFDKELRKILKNPFKRQNAGVIGFIKNSELQHPLRIVDINATPIELGDLIICKEHFKSTKLKYSSLPMILINDNDLMTSAGIYYTQNQKGQNEQDPPIEIIIDSYTYKDAKGNTQTVKENIPLLKAVQPSNKLDGSTFMGMFYSMTAVDNWRKFLKDNKNIIYAALGIAAGVGITVYLLYQMTDVDIPQIKSGVNACKQVLELMKNVPKNVTQLG